MKDQTRVMESQGIRRGIVFSLLVLCAPGPGQANPAFADQPEEKASTSDESEGKKGKTSGEAQDPLASFKFGGAIGVSITPGAQPVDQAEVVNNVVRVTEASRAVPRLLLEVHRPFITWGVKERTVSYRIPKTRPTEQETGRPNASITMKELDDSPVTDIGEPTVVTRSVNLAGWGMGPFAAVQSGGSNVIDGFAAGVMFSILRQPETGSDFNIGIGAVLDKRVKTLGDGVVANQPLPAGETAVRFKEEARWSFVVLFSVGGR